MTQLSNQRVKLFLWDDVEGSEAFEILANVRNYRLFDRGFYAPRFALYRASDPRYRLVELTFCKGQIEAEHRPYEDDRGRE